jgi:potassium-dependent mechanosensitive channel
MLQTLLTENVLARRHVDIGVSTSVTRLLHYALVSVGFVLALVVLGVDLTKMTLLVSALGVGIGFGLQTIVNNFVCGLILLLERPLRVGDTIELGGQLAKIAKIGLRSTTVRTGDQADVIVPNAELITNRVTNWTLTNRQARSIIPVGVWVGHCARYADAERVRAGPPRSAATSRAAGVVPPFRGQCARF